MPSRVRWRTSVQASIVVLLITAAQAEMSGDDYRSTADALSPAERAQVQADLQAAQAAEAAAAEREQAQLQARARALAAHRAQRPAGERLLEARCTACHDTAFVNGARRGALGWRWTVARMRWWHGAPLASGDARRISDHLASTQPASHFRVWLERLTVGALAAVAVAFAGLAWTRWLRPEFSRATEP